MRLTGSRSVTHKGFVPPIRDLFHHHKTIMHKTCYLLILTAVIILPGCASAPKEKSADGITFRRTDKFEKVWIADGFDFSGYNAILMQPVATTVTPKDDKERERLEMVRHTLTRDFASTIEFKQIVPTFVGKEADLKPDSRALRLENTVTEFSAGSMAARVMVGMGAGTPRLRVRGQLVDKESSKPVLIYELDETAPILGANWQSSRTLQSTAATELAEDVADFFWQVSKKQPIKYK